MLDASNFAQNATVYRATDPAQVIYRSLLAAFSEAQLMKLEDEIGSFSLTGLLPESVRSILDAAETQEA